MPESRAATGLVLAVGGAFVVFRAVDRAVCFGGDCGPTPGVLAAGLVLMASGGLLLAGVSE